MKLSEAQDKGVYFHGVSETPDDRDGSTTIGLNIINSPRIIIGNKYINDFMNDEKVIKEIHFHKYVWKSVKSSSTMERISCGFVALSVIFCFAVVIYHFAFVAGKGDPIKAPADWFITRDLWLATQFDHSVQLEYSPIKLVVVQHSVSLECYNFIECATELRDIQDFYLHQLNNSDIPYNFLVGNDGRVYEGRGWGVRSVSSRWFNHCLISIGFIGDYRRVMPTHQQLNRTNMLLAEGVRDGHLDPNYVLLGAKDLLATESPGTYLYEAIQEFDHYVHNNQYRFMSCAKIHATEDNPFVDEAPHEWFIDRKGWGARPFDGFVSTDWYKPLRLVIINDFPTRECFIFTVCEAQIQNLQGIYLLTDTEIPHNFMIGNDGRAYEARGWEVEGGDNSGQFQPCALNIGFFGNYTDFESPSQVKVSPAQINRTMMLLEEGVRKGFLHKDYIVVGAKDILNSISPGEYLHNEIKTWDHYISDSMGRDFTCDSLAIL